MVSNDSIVSEKKQVLILNSEWHLANTKEWPWPLILIWLHLAECSKSDLGVQWVKVTKGHILNSFCSTYVHNAAYQVSRSSVIWFRRIIFLRFLPYMGMVAMLVKCPKPFEKLFIPLTSGGCIWNLVIIGPAVSAEKLFGIVDWQIADGRMTKPTYLSYKLPQSLQLRWAENALNKWAMYIFTLIYLFLLRNFFQASFFSNHLDNNFWDWANRKYSLL